MTMRAESVITSAAEDPLQQRILAGIMIVSLQDFEQALKHGTVLPGHSGLMVLMMVFKHQWHAHPSGCYHRGIV